MSATNNLINITEHHGPIYTSYTKTISKLYNMFMTLQIDKQNMLFNDMS